MDFCSVGFVIHIEGHKDASLLFAYLNEADFYTICSSLYLQSNNMNSLKSLFLEEKKDFSMDYLKIKLIF